MRVTRRIDPNDDRGVSAVIVAVALVAIFAMVVLVVDAGALLVKRRAMVRAADAAALAAAQTCLRDDGSAEAEADTFAALNVSSAVAGGISEALVTTAFGLFVAVPAVWAYNWFTNKVEAFGIEMTNSSSELMDYFIKQQGARR